MQTITMYSPHNNADEWRTALTASLQDAQIEVYWASNLTNPQGRVIALEAKPSELKQRTGNIVPIHRAGEHVIVGPVLQADRGPCWTCWEQTQQFFQRQPLSDEPLASSVITALRDAIIASEALETGQYIRIEHNTAKRYRSVQNPTCPNCSQTATYPSEHLQQSIQGSAR